MIPIEKVHPTRDRLLVHLNPGVQETPHGIIVPPSIQQITQHGRVLAVGPDCNSIHEGDTVVLQLHCGIEVGQRQNTPIILVEMKDILGVLTD